MFESMVYAAFEFIGVALKQKEVKEIVLKQEDNTPCGNNLFKTMVETIIFYMQITKEQV
jgi:hypothetical protein